MSALSISSNFHRIRRTHLIATILGVETFLHFRFGDLRSMELPTNEWIAAESEWSFAEKILNWVQEHLLLIFALISVIAYRVEEEIYFQPLNWIPSEFEGYSMKYRLSNTISSMVSYHWQHQPKLSFLSHRKRGKWYLFNLDRIKYLIKIYMCCEFAFNSLVVLCFQS